MGKRPEAALYIFYLEKEGRRKIAYVRKTNMKCNVEPKKKLSVAIVNKCELVKSALYTF